MTRSASFPTEVKDVLTCFVLLANPEVPRMGALHVSFLKVQRQGESEAAITDVSRNDRLANSIRRFCGTASGLANWGAAPCAGGAHQLAPERLFLPRELPPLRVRVSVRVSPRPLLVDGDEVALHTHQGR